MTGKYPYRVGRQHMYIKPLMPTGIPVNVPLMPDYFKKAGYMTHAIGKWHLGSHSANYTPTQRGFAEHVGYWTGHEDYYDHTAQELYGPVVCIFKVLKNEANAWVGQVQSQRMACELYA